MSATPVLLIKIKTAFYWETKASTALHRRQLLKVLAGAAAILVDTMLAPEAGSDWSNLGASVKIAKVVFGISVNASLLSSPSVYADGRSVAYLQGVAFG